jgi:Na+/phosphate symporter
MGDIYVSELSANVEKGITEAFGRLSETASREAVDGVSQYLNKLYEEIVIINKEKAMNAFRNGDNELAYQIIEEMRDVVSKQRNQLEVIFDDLYIDPDMTTSITDALNRLKSMREEISSK